MSKKKPSKQPTTEAAPQTEAAAALEKKAKRAKSPTATETAKPEKKKREPKEKVQLRTVALRVPEEEFQLLHRAAGPRNLAGFMRTTLIFAAQKALSK